MNFDTDILIAGGGLNGCALALALASVGQRVTLVDPQPAKTHKDPKFDGRAYAVALATQRMLKVMGLWEEVEDHAQPMLDIKVSDGRAGEGASPLHVHFDHSELAEGPMGYLVEDRFLRNALLAQIATDDLITHATEVSVIKQSITLGHASISLSDGNTLTARLLIGADGRRSAVATRAGIKRSGWDYKQTSLVCAIDHTLPHNATAHQFFTPAGPLAILPLKGNRSSIVWTENNERAAVINAMNDASYLDALRPVFGDFLGDLSLSGQRFSYPLGLSIAQEFAHERVALVGDAAHGIHPLAGQGLNLGLRDVAALAEVIADAARRGEDIGSLQVLRRYQTWRRGETVQMAAATDTINRVFSNDNPLIRLGRDLGLGAVNAVPSVRRGFMRKAAGLSGNLPKLLQGRQI